MRYVWRFIAKKIDHNAPFLGVHIVDTTTMRPYCDAPGDLEDATTRPDGYVLGCVACLEYAEWRINHG